ncbi:MAG: TlpA family protein disulfide reductase [Brevefilum fermentans]|uniref:Putative Thiol-disulfide oxidoreductase n=1 Tax=Candidatus Brevifilum fermentans TaxID=1986204 RepID=A0A1Y6K951_9CHLR|nr:TlpA disulfide reductase family protein [Brevefilum fermentans]MDI9566460.1 TlpA disulfide reductase family protein [Chloroflexota bacterium]SMX54550.1 putative Thiol-disulfide oxidoreductase [Brevefilum fermentans]HOM67162.1 TlpA disulfide reductase family protein [Brevefilum fermentans]
MKNLKNKHWLIDVGLIFLIIGLGILVVLELRQSILLKRQQVNPPSNETVSEITVPEGTNPNPETITEELSPEEQSSDLFTLDGKPVALEDYQGTPMLVNFWATWCPPCLAEMPLFQSYAERYDDRLVVLAINAGEDESVVRNFVDQHGFELTFLLDPTSAVVHQNKVFGFPTTLFFNESGELVKTHIGELNADLIERYLLLLGLNE